MKELRNNLRWDFKEYHQLEFKINLEMNERFYDVPKSIKGYEKVKYYELMKNSKIVTIK